MLEKIPGQVKYDIRKIIATHAHVIHRVKKGDERTMRTHTMSMMDGIERVLLKHDPELFTWKKRSIIKRLFQHLFRVKNQYSTDAYVNQVCLVMQAYRYRTDLISARSRLLGKDEIKQQKKKHTTEAIQKLFHITL